MIKAILLGHKACKGILNKLEAGQMVNRCASEESIAIIKAWADATVSALLAASVVKDDRMLHKARMWKYDALHVSDNCLSKDSQESR